MQARHFFQTYVLEKAYFSPQNMIFPIENMNFGKQREGEKVHTHTFVIWCIIIFNHLLKYNFHTIKSTCSYYIILNATTNSL